MKKLKAFLTSKRLWSKYKRNIQGRLTRNSIGLEYLLEISREIDYIDGMFDWSDEELDLWIEIDEQWKEHIKK